MELPTSSYKIVILGEIGVGKSCIMNRYMKNVFLNNHETTIGAAFMVKNLSIGERKLKFEIWDTAGQERYKSLAPMYYRGSDAAIVVYDVTNPDSFEKAKSWIYELRRKAKSVCVIVLVGNKIDLENQVPKSDVNYFIEEEDILFEETSAKTGCNIHELFNKIAEKLPIKSQIPTNLYSLTSVNSIRTTDISLPPKKSCCANYSK